MPGLLMLWPAKALSPKQVTKGGAQASAAILSQATRGLLAAGAAAVLGSTLSQAIRGLTASGEAFALASFGSAVRGMTAVGFAIAQDLGLLTVVHIVFTRGMVSVRSGDAVMPGVAVPDPSWGNTGGPSR